MTGDAMKAVLEERPAERPFAEDDAVELLRQVGAPAPRPESQWATSVLCVLVNQLTLLRPKSEAEVRLRDREHRRNRSDDEDIAIGSAEALKGIALVVREIESSKLDWLYSDLPKDPNDPWAARRDQLICKYERAISILAQAQDVLAELRAVAVAAPSQTIRLHITDPDPEFLGRLHELYVQITGHNGLSHTGSAVKFISLLINQIGWNKMELPAIYQALFRYRKQERRKDFGEYATLDVYILLAAHLYRSKR
jgi:hypothetical protein